MDNVKILEVKQSIFASNDEQAAQLRQSLKEKKIFLLNLMSAPGSGKTTTLRSTIAALKDELRIGVMEADIDSDVDAKAIAAAGAKAVAVAAGSMACQRFSSSCTAARSSCSCAASRASVCLTLLSS